jgi:glycerophosphoryl diester phosphodiesterase
MHGHLDIRGEIGTPEFTEQKKLLDSLQKDEEVHIEMEFKFELAEDMKLSKDEVVRTWDNIAQPTSHIYISADQTKLLEVVNMRSAIIYVIDNKEEVHH